MVALYSLTIYAKDNHGATASQTIFVQIEDVNEPPVFIGSLTQKNQGTNGLFWGKASTNGLFWGKASPEDTDVGPVLYVLCVFMVFGLEG